jgi:hypothetical protein
MDERMKIPGLEEAVVSATRSLGSNGRGKGGVRGHMIAMASIEPKRFARLLEKALQLKSSEWRGGKASVSYEQAEARIKKMSVDDIVIEYVIHVVTPLSMIPQAAQRTSGRQPSRPPEGSAATVAVGTGWPAISGCWPRADADLSTSGSSLQWRSKPRAGLLSPSRR